MLGRAYEGLDCSLARALERVGERWTLLILRDACLRGTHRFSDFQRLGVARNILASRLRQLTQDGLLERRVDPQHPERIEYHPTPLARDLVTSLAALMQWGDRHLAPDDPPVTFTHDDCGGEAVATLICSACGKPVGPGELHGTGRAAPGATTGR